MRGSKGCILANNLVLDGPVGAGSGWTRRPVAGAPLADSRSAHWHDRNRNVSLPHAFSQLEAYGNLGNLRALADNSGAEFRGPLFADSDVYKVLEAAAWELGHADDVRIREFYESTVDIIQRAQRSDGYLDSAYQDRPGFEPWTDFAHGHELYCLGHLIQAAVAAKRALGDERLIEVCEKFVAHVIDRIGGPDHREYCGHPLIESALVEFGRATGSQDAIDLAETLVRRRGSGFVGDAHFGAIYYQDDVSVQETEIMRGHAVRAMYLNQGVADLYLERGNDRDFASLERQWNDLVTKRMYITGGTGSRHQDEAFGDPFELPSDRAYAETCAGIALFGWAWRMYLATGETDYLDRAEVSFFNTVLAGISAQGNEFTYTNPLQRRPEHVGGRQEEGAQRFSWFGCACCPPNVMRTIGSLEHYVATQSDEAVEIAHFLPSTLNTEDVTLELRTTYPDEAALSIQVVTGNSDRELRVRLPHWAQSFGTVTVDGAAVEARTSNGWVHLTGVLRQGSVIRLEAAMEFRRVTPPRRADAIRGTVAFMRGPVVYCAEQVDNAADIDAVELERGARPSSHDQALSTELGPLADLSAVERPIEDVVPMYRETPVEADPHPATLTVRPYATWGNQELGAMRVWIPERRDAE